MVFIHTKMVSLCLCRVKIWYLPLHLHPVRPTKLIVAMLHVDGEKSGNEANFTSGIWLLLGPNKKLTSTRIFFIPVLIGHCLTFTRHPCTVIGCCCWFAPSTPFRGFPNGTSCILGIVLGYPKEWIIYEMTGEKGAQNMINLTIPQSTWQWKVSPHNLDNISDKWKIKM